MPWYDKNEEGKWFVMDKEEYCDNSGSFYSLDDLSFVPRTYDVGLVTGAYPRSSSNYQVHYERCKYCDVKMPINESCCLSCGAPL